LREELFNRFQSNLGNKAALTPEEEAEKKAKEKKARAEASLREREQQVRGKQQEMERDLRRSKQGANREEAEREFGSLLVQAIREHDASWADALPSLEKDPRFQHPGLSLADKQRLFQAHLESIARKRLDALHKLFESHAPKLNTPFEDVFPEIVNDFAVTRLGLSPEKLEQRFDQWQQVRFQSARKDFETLLKENSFVDFWGRMRNKQVDEKAYIPENEDEDDEYGAEGGGKANLANMAKSVDLKEMHAVLRVSATPVTGRFGIDSFFPPSE
jgi:transcription elongation regulator 1